MMSPPRKLSRRTSFQQLDRDSAEQENEDGDEDEEEQVAAQVTPKSAKSRGKQRYDHSPEPVDVPIQEDDYGNDDFEDGGLPRIDEEPEPMDFDEPEEPQEPQEETPKASKSKRKDPPSPAKEKTKKRSRKENADPSKARKRHDGILREGRLLTPKPLVSSFLTYIIVIQDNNLDHPEGTRRSRRTRFPPLEYWRMEKVVYGRPDHGKSVIPVVKEILRVPKEDPKPLGAKKRKYGRAKSKTAEPEGIWDPEEGWDDGTPTHGIVWGVKEAAEINKRELVLLFKIC